MNGRKIVYSAVGGVVVVVGIGAWFLSSALVGSKPKPVTNPKPKTEQVVKNSVEGVQQDDFGILSFGEKAEKKLTDKSEKDILDRLKVILPKTPYGDSSKTPEITYFNSGVVLAKYNKFSVILDSSVGQVVGFIDSSKESPFTGYTNIVQLRDDLYLHLGLQTQGLLRTDGTSLVEYKDFESVKQEKYAELGLSKTIEVMPNSLSSLTGKVEVDGYVYSVDGTVLAYKVVDSITYYYRSNGTASSPYWKIAGASGEKLNLELVSSKLLGDGVLSYGIYTIGGKTVWLGLE